MVMVYAGGHRSGGHYNPAVSLGVFMRKGIQLDELLSYWAAQILAGILAFVLGWYITGKTVAIEPQATYGPMQALIVETIFTFALVLVVLNTAASKKTEGNSYYGLAIGFTVVIAAIAAGPISGGAFNPAVGIGATVVHASLGRGSWSSLWIPILGPFLGAIVAALLFNMQESASES